MRRIDLSPALSPEPRIVQHGACEGQIFGTVDDRASCQARLPPTMSPPTSPEPAVGSSRPRLVPTLEPVDHEHGRCSQRKDEGERDKDSDHVVHDAPLAIEVTRPHQVPRRDRDTGVKAVGIVDLGYESPTQRPGPTGLPLGPPPLPRRD